MSEQHTQGLMTVYKDNADAWPLLMIGGPTGRIVANVNTEAGVDTSKAPSIAFKPMPAEANARRLAACWNACEQMGISTEALESGPDSVFMFAGDMKAQRDQLLAALQKCRSMVGHPDNIAFIDTAIAKATGGAL